MSDYVLIGGGGLARELLDWFSPILAEQGSGFVGYLDDGDDPMACFGGRLRQLGAIHDHQPGGERRLVMAIGGPAGKASVAQALQARGAAFASLVHPRAWVSASARIEAGAVVGPFAHVSADAHVGELVLQGAYAGVGHDASVGPYSSLSGSVDLNGGVQVGHTCLVGSGARLLPGVRVGDRCTVGAGAVVVRDVPEGSTVYAQPARRL